MLPGKGKEPGSSDQVLELVSLGRRGADKPDKRLPYPGRFPGADGKAGCGRRPDRGLPGVCIQVGDRAGIAAGKEAAERTLPGIAWTQDIRNG